MQYCTRSTVYCTKGNSFPYMSCFLLHSLHGVSTLDYGLQNFTTGVKKRFQAKVSVCDHWHGAWIKSKRACSRHRSSGAHWTLCLLASKEGGNSRYLFSFTALKTGIFHFTASKMATLHFTVVYGFYILHFKNSILQLHGNFFSILQGYLYYNFTP